MTFSRRLGSVVLATALIFAVAGGTPARAGTDRPKELAALQKQEVVARVKVADEIRRVALYCALKSDFDGARRDYAKAVAFNPANEALATDLVKIKGKKGKPLKADLDEIADRRKKCLARCADLLAPAAAAYAKADCSDELAALVATMRVNSMPTDDVVAKLDLVLYEPYLDWRTKAAVAKLDAGWEYADGAWADPPRVAAMDAAHATWTNPWVFADDVHEIRSNLPRRLAKQVAAHVWAYRRFFLAYFTGEWQLVPPDVKLPVIVTRTRAEMEERAHMYPGAPPAPPNAAAFYLDGDGVGNPCFVSVETNAATRESVVLDFEQLQQTFEHELGHQIAFEYSKHGDVKPGGSIEHYLWVIEGVAEFLPSYDLVGGVWKLHLRPWIGTGETRMEAAFAWCHDNVDRIPQLSRFVALPPQQFLTPANYHIAAALTYYLLEGKEREYRQEYVALIDAVHHGTAGPEALGACFPGDTLSTIDKEFREFCKGLVIAEK